MARHVMTAKRKIALRKAQAASARKRRGRHRSNVKAARKSLHLQNARSGNKKGQRKANYKKYNRAVYASHRSVGRGKANSRARTAARVGARRGIKTVGVAALVAPGPTAAVLGTAGLAAYHVPKGFGKGVKRGYTTRRARDSAAKRNLSRHDFGKATATRIGPLAITATSTVHRGRGHSSGNRAHRR